MYSSLVRLEPMDEQLPPFCVGERQPSWLCVQTGLAKLPLSAEGTAEARALLNCKKYIFTVYGWI